MSDEITAPEETPAVDFNHQQLDDFDRRITERVGRASLIDGMKKKTKSVKKDIMSFTQELADHWYIYAMLAVSALFTGTLGVYMGLAPTKTLTGISFCTDTMHVFLAVVYAIAFITITEASFVLGKYLFFTREEENNTQQLTSLAMMGISGLSIMLTGIAGGFVIAVNISFMTEFMEVPEAAQRWIIIVIPIMLSIYAFMLAAYQLSSREASSERLARETQRKMETDFRTRRRATKQIMLEDLQTAELISFVKKVQEGTMTAADALASMSADKMLGASPTPQMALDTKGEELKNA